MSVRDLSARLMELGRPILPSGITKIEQGGRRVDADDLVALATAFDVPPLSLLWHAQAGFDFWAKVEEYDEAGVLNALVRDVRAALSQNIDPDWLVYFLEILVRMLPIFEATSKELHPSAREDQQWPASRNDLTADGALGTATPQARNAQSTSTAR